METKNLEQWVADLGGKQGAAAVTLYMMGVADGNLQAMEREKTVLERSLIFNFHFFMNKQLGDLNKMIACYSAHYEQLKKDLMALDPKIWETNSKFNEGVDETPAGILQ